MKQTTLLIIIFFSFQPLSISAESSDAQSTDESVLTFEAEEIKGELYGPKGAVVDAGKKMKKIPLFKAPKDFKKKNKALKEQILWR